MILHIDMDAFFASVEQRDNPALKNKPVVVCGNSPRAVVSTASYEARQFGIHSAMPLFQARQRCSHLMVVPGNMEKYAEESQKIMAIISQFSPLVEPVSIDEAYADVTGCETLFGPPRTIAMKIKQAIFTGLSLSPQKISGQNCLGYEQTRWNNPYFQRADARCIKRSAH